MTSLISTRAEVCDAFKKAKAYSDGVIVEEYLKGRDFRIHVMNGKAYRARERIPGGVSGDGISSIETLIARLNRDPKRGPPGANTELTRIDIDEETHRMLQKQDLNISDVPSENQFVRLRSIANVSVGGITNEFPMDRIHPDNIILAESAVKAVNIDIAAVDFITPDIEISWRVAGGGICEINHKPQFGEDAISYLFNEFFPSTGRIPSILTLGKSFDLEIHKSLARRLMKRNIRSGFATTEGAWAGETQLPGILENGAFDTFSLLLQNREVDAILINWDSNLKFAGLPTPDLAALFLIGEIPQECTSEDISELARRSRKVFISDANKSHLTEINLDMSKIENMMPSEQLDKKLEALICEYYLRNVCNEAVR